jgi:hypothetical protein
MSDYQLSWRAVGLWPFLCCCVSRPGVRRQLTAFRPQMVLRPVGVVDVFAFSQLRANIRR